MLTSRTEYCTKDLLSRVRGGWVHIAVLAGVAVVPMTAGADAVLEERAIQALGLYAGTVAALDVDRTPGVSQEVAVPLGEDTVNLQLHRHSVRSNRYEIRVQLADGSYINVEPGPVRTVRGQVDGIAGSVVAGSVSDAGLTAMIELPDGERWWIEPLATRIDGAAAEHHVIYNGRDVIPHGGSCATEVHGVGLIDDDGPSADGGACPSEIRVAELACDADVEYFNRWGSVSGVEDRINLVMGTVDVQYERDVLIRHDITTIIVRTAEPDPYSSFDPVGLLYQFRNYWLSNHQNVQRDVAQLFTGRNINGGVIGIAFNIGVMCSNQAYCLVQSDFNNNFQSATDLSAHELGHLWNGIHCSCQSPPYTMYFSLTSANRFHPSHTIPRISAYRNAINNACLSDTASPPNSVYPFFDSFSTLDVDPALWVNDGVEVTDNGDGEPSPPYSLNFNNSDSITTGLLDGAAANCDIAVEYYFQRTGNGGSPEEGEDLIVDYRNSNCNWVEIARHEGDGPDDLPYELIRVVLGPDANHAALQIRWRMINAESYDYFFVDDVRIGCAEDAVPPVVLHGTGQPGQTRPFSGYIDPRSESSDGVVFDRGISEVAIRFSEPVQHIGGGPLGIDSFEVTETGAGDPPSVVSVNVEAMPLVVVTLDRPITLQEYTTIRAMVQDLADIPNVMVNAGNQGPDVDESDRVDIGFLPTDVDQTGTVTPFDLLEFRRIVNGQIDPDAGTVEDHVDMDRDGSVSPFDLLLIRQLLNGVSPATQSWKGVSMNNPRP